MKLFHKLIGFTILLSFLLQLSGKFVVLLDYAINKDFIASVLCVNKDVVDSTCEGKCHLKKQLDKKDQEQQQSTNPFNEIKDFELYSEFSSVINFIPSSLKLASNTVFNYMLRVSSKHLLPVYHPPQA